MLSSVEQAFVGRDEKRAPLKTPAWEARYNSTFREMFIANLQHLFHSDIDITGTDHFEVSSNSDSSSNSSAKESSAESEDYICFL